MADPDTNDTSANVTGRHTAMKSHANWTRLCCLDLGSPVHEEEMLDKPRIILQKIQFDELGKNLDERLFDIYRLDI